MLKNTNEQTVTDSKMIKQRYGRIILYSRDVNIQDTLIDSPCLQEPLILVRLALQSFPSWKTTGIDGISTETWQTVKEESIKF